VRAPDTDALGASRLNGTIMPDKGLIMYRGDMDDDLVIMTILHEIGHEMFPEWETEPNQSSTSELGIFERDLKAFLEAAGVDLSPLLVE
jgi:hypothetical protein